VQARKIKVNTRELYDEHAADYDSSCVKWNSALSALKQPPVGFEEFPRFEEWVGRESVDGETFLKYLTRAWYESGRNHERNIELQQVRVNNAPSSSDHTFATIKNIYQPTTQGQGDRVKMVWDMVKNTTGEVVSAACVTTTAVGAYAHAANSLKTRRGDSMGICFTDNWPTSEDVLNVLWDMSCGRLDIWHWMRRITKMLRDWHVDYGAALSALSHVVYHWDDDDVAAVGAALRNGTLNGTIYSTEQIAELKASGKFWRNYKQYIRKHVHQRALTIVERAREWEAMFANKTDPKIGLPLATGGFDVVFERELELAVHLVDKEDHNFAVRPKPGSKHGLTTWRSSRGAKVETSHLSSRHYANQGLNSETFQFLQMEGTCMWNADRREDSKQAVGEDGDMGARAETRVGHYRPWLRRERNRLAQAANHPLPYPEDGLELPEDNGERFYFEYAIEQEQRNADFGGVLPSAADIIEAGGCTCNSCSLLRDQGKYNKSPNINFRGLTGFFILSFRCFSWRCCCCYCYCCSARFLAPTFPRLPATGFSRSHHHRSHHHGHPVDSTTSSSSCTARTANDTATSSPSADSFCC